MRVLFVGMMVVLGLVGCQNGLMTEATSNRQEIGLRQVLDAQPSDVQARYEWRHPQQTLTFFGIEPGMTVVEALPGGGWYSKILIPYLGPQGVLVGADYPWSLWKKFGFMDADTLEKRKSWVNTWVTDTQAWGIDNAANVRGAVLGEFPESMDKTVDAVLFIRALHNLARFEGDGQYLSSAINGAYRVLKPGGIVGVVQHEARENMPDSWSQGDKGYLKKQFVIAQFEKAGFKFAGETDINQNPKDSPTVDDVVWRLPPAMYTVRDNPELKKKMETIGESNRMTLKFIKPVL